MESDFIRAICDVAMETLSCLCVENGYLIKRILSFSMNICGVFVVNPNEVSRGKPYEMCLVSSL